MQAVYQLAMLLVLHFKGYSILGLTDETVRRSLILHFKFLLFLENVKVASISTQWIDCIG